MNKAAILVWSFCQEFLFFFIRIICFVSKKSVLKKRISFIEILKRQILLRREKEKTYLFFVSSAGEYEQVKPLISFLEKDSYVQIIFFSDSGYKFADAKKIKTPYVICPPDSIWRWETFFEILRPDFVIVNKYELWPSFLYVAKKYSQLWLVNFFVYKKSNTLSELFKKMLLQNFDKIFSISSSTQKEILERYQISSDKAFIAKDTKYDCLLIKDNEKIAKIKESISLLKSKKYILVLGSTWDQDLKLLEQAFIDNKSFIKDVLIVIAPHKPEDSFLRSIYFLLCRYKLSFFKFTDILEKSNNKNFKSVSECDAIVIDNLGYLASWYAFADLAYIGGAMHYQVHNVIEPASYGIPIAFGPKYKSSAEARRLVEENLASVVADEKEFQMWVENSKLLKPQLAVSFAEFFKENKGGSEALYSLLVQ